MRDGKLWLTMMGMAALLGLLAGCGDDGGDGGDDDDDITAELRVWHLAADAGDVDVFVDGAPLLEGFAFEEVTPYQDLPVGSYDIAVAPAGMGIEAAVITVDGFTVAEGDRFTVAAVQLDADPAAAGAFDALAIDESGAPPSGTNIAFRIFHAAFAVPQAVDVYDAAAPDTALITGLAQGTAAGNALEVPNGAYTFGLDVTDPPDGTIDLQTGMPLDMPPDGSPVLLGVISKPEGEEVETEVVFVVGEGVHDEVELEPVGD